MIRTLALLSTFLGILLAWSLVANAQIYPRACFQGGIIIQCPAAPATTPVPGSTPAPLPTPPGGGGWFETFTVGDAQFRRYQVALNPTVGGTALPITGFVSNTTTGAVLPINIAGVTPGTLTLPTQPVGATTYLAIEVSTVDGTTQLLTSSVSLAAIIPTSAAFHIVWNAVMPAGATGMRVVGSPVTS